MSASGGGRGLCSVMGAFSFRCGGGGRLTCGWSMAWGGTGGDGWSCCARTGTASARVSAPPSPALRHRAIVSVRIAPLPLQSLQELPRVRRFRRLRVLRGQLVENRLRFRIAPENAEAAPALELRLRDGIASRILERKALEELQGACAVSADFADQAGQIERVVGGAVLRIGGDEREQVGLRLDVAPFVALAHRVRPDVIGVE